MGFLDRIRTKIITALRSENPSMTDEQAQRVDEELQRALDEQPPPRIALIGSTGVGEDIDGNTRRERRGTARNRPTPVRTARS